MRDLLHNTQANMEGGEEEEAGDDDGSILPKMELQPFEHYDYIMLTFRNEQDFQQACERLGIKKVQVEYPGGKLKVGLGRVIDGAKAIKMLVEGK